MLVKCMYLINFYYYRKIKTNARVNNLESKLQSLCECTVFDKFPERFRINHCFFLYVQFSTLTNINSQLSQLHYIKFNVQGSVHRKYILIYIV